MENAIIATNEKEAEKAYATRMKMVDGRLFAIRVFFPKTNAETMQEKIERILHRDIVNAIRQTVA